MNRSELKRIIKEIITEAIFKSGDKVKIDMKKAREHAKKQGIPGKHWLNIVNKEIKYDNGILTIGKISGNSAEVYGNPVSGRMSSLSISIDMLKRI